MRGFAPSHSEAKRVACEMNSFGNMAIKKYEEIASFGQSKSTDTKVAPSKVIGAQIGDEAFAKKALMKYLVVYVHATGKGCLIPDEKDATLLGVSGLENNVFLFQYIFVDGLKIKVSVVPDQISNTAEVRVAGNQLFENHKHNWLTLKQIL